MDDLLTRRRLLALASAALAFVVSAHAAEPTTRPAGAGVYVDEHATLRWAGDGREVALFGANYCLTSALDYRAAGYVKADRKQLIDQDMAHFNRMGFDGLRVCLWGDWENSDAQGNLIANDHLDVMDYLVARASARGIHMLLSPIVTYSSLWPDLKDDPAVQGFSKHFEKNVLGTDPAAIAAQQNYLRQLLNHVNPYTGRAVKDEPNILFVEMINEPWHHSKDPAGSVKYIDALVQAVRDTGCQKPTFFNLSQDFAMAKPIRDSKVDGQTFAWYPSGLNAGHELHGNFLRFLDAFPHMSDAPIPSKPRIVYEFDLPDVISGYHYPAMVREFREAGAQFAAMFSYDFLATAPYNLGWTTHLLNMVYTPRKAAAAIIAAEAMRDLPLGKGYGDYPANTRFGDVRVSYEEDLAELVTPTQFLYSNDTKTAPPQPATLARIVGLGSSPVVTYPGEGLYFLDKVDDGRWRLEVYPDVVEVSDPFHDPKLGKTCFRLIARSHPMTIALPDLGNAFSLAGLNEGNAASAKATAGRFDCSPGVYLLSRDGVADRPLPDRVGGVAMREFVCPAPQDSPPAVMLPAPPAAHSAGRPLHVTARVASAASPASVTLVARVGDGQPFDVPMRESRPYTFVADVPADRMTPGTLRYAIEVRDDRATLSFPAAAAPDAERVPDGASYATQIVAPEAELTLFDAQADGTEMSQTRAGWAKPTYVPAMRDGHQALRVNYAADAKSTPEDFSRSMYIGDRIQSRDDAAASATAVVVRARGETDASTVRLTLVDKDGAAWATSIKPGTTWRELTVPLASFAPASWAMLPQAFPDDLAYWCGKTPATTLVPANLERLQLSLRKADLGGGSRDTFCVDVESVGLVAGDSKRN